MEQLDYNHTSENENNGAGSVVLFVVGYCRIVWVIGVYHFIIFTNLLLYHIDYRKRGKGVYIAEFQLFRAKQILAWACLFKD